MKLTKYTHACVRLEQDGRVLVLDPGTFSETEEALDGAQAVLITHEHGDHVDVPAMVNA
ncbi:MAG: MBL fold metallo-hydrolase, partial [Actinomycetota bacterium]|nr:MBL fold metallo-hydrolase [Actinomycetota bacterium]